MRRFIVAFSVALAGAAILQAQDVKSTTTIKADDSKTVVYTGCLQTGTETKSYVLQNAIPVKDTKTETTVGKSGMPETTTTTTTSYVLVPGEKVDFTQNVGHKVEVTATAIPAGDDHSKIETQTKTEVAGQSTQKTQTTEKVAQGSFPQLRVISVKHLSDRCEP
jgi:predicted small secreted protein